ncbi:MAG TPA: metal-dependent hydrolase [Burkholderiales bacterium]|nr:metal-dependent hydrolase [Burkholderiales bacterium]
MDTLTHALSGALFARATAPENAPPRSLARRVAAGFFACAAPDLDFVVAFVGPVEYLENHRGVTHSLILLPLWAFVVSWVLAKILREPRGWRALYGVTALGLALHIAGDVITSYGTMILAPFSDWRAQIGTTFIIDLWFSGIIVAGLVASAILYRSRWTSVAAGAVLVAYVGFQYLQKEKAIEFGGRYARSLGLGGAAVNVQPRPVSPFNWTVFVSDAEAHRFAHVNLIREEPRAYRPGDGFIAMLDSVYEPLSAAHWETRTRYGEGARKTLAREAWNSPAMAVYRWFAELPAFDGMSAGPTCAWFIDLRFYTPGRATQPFRYGACQEGPETGWRLVPP